MNRVLIIDDDVELVELLTEYLRREGLVADAVYAGEDGLHRALSGDYAAVILDVMLPGIGGFEVLRRIRTSENQLSNIPVLMLTARGDEIDRVLGLELGADDYLPKPFSARELVARLRAILRRATPQPETAESGQERAGRDGSRSDVYHIGDVELDTAAREVRCAGEILDLTAVEFNLLEMLLHAAGEVVTRETIAQEVLGRSLLPYDRSVDTHISNLRRKLGTENGAERIKTVRSVGYIYTRPAPRNFSSGLNGNTNNNALSGSR